MTERILTLKQQGKDGQGSRQKPVHSSVKLIAIRRPEKKFVASFLTENNPLRCVAVGVGGMWNSHSSFTVNVMPCHHAYPYTDKNLQSCPSDLGKTSWFSATILGSSS